MAFRSLTDVYILMRNNAISNKSVLHDQSYDDRAALVLNLDGNNSKMFLKLPPDWTSDVDEVQFDITKIKNKFKELSLMHDKHLNRPTLDDNDDEEKAIDLQTQELTRILNQCQMKIKNIANKARRGSPDEQRLIRNVISSLANALQQQTISFRTAQSVYLKKIKSREERSKMPFDAFKTSAIMMEDTVESEKLLMHDWQQFESLTTQSKVNLDEREKEIDHIVRSIQDLNEVFKDLAVMISDQGTVLDRIDYNIEKVAVSVKGGLENLNKAAQYQKKDRKMYCILVLCIIVIVLFLLLIVTKIIL